MRKYPYGLTGTIRVYDMRTGAFLRFERQGGMPEEVPSEAGLTIDAEEIRYKVAQERANAFATVERDYEGV